MPKRKKNGPTSNEERLSPQCSAWHNQERCRALRECEEQLKYWKARYQRLKQEHKRIGRLRALKTDAASVWDHLTVKEKVNKETLLTILRESPTLPDALKTSSWWEDVLPSTLQGDAELWRARFQRQKDCFQPFNGFCWERLPLYNMLCQPLKLLDLKDVWQLCLEYDSTLLCDNRICDFLGDTNVVSYEWLVSLLIHILTKAAKPVLPPASKRDLEDVHFAADCFLGALDFWERNWEGDDVFGDKDENDHHTEDSVASESKTRSHQDHGKKKTTRPLTPKQQLALRLRNDPQLQKALWQNPFWSQKTPKLGPELRNNKAFVLQLPTLGSEYFPPDALRAVSKRLQADIEVVLAFCRRHGGNLSWASSSLRRHYGCVTTAMQTTPRSIVACIHGPLRRRLWKTHSVELFDGIRRTGHLLSPEQLQNCSVFHVCPASKFSPGSQLACLWKTCPKPVQQQRFTLVAAARAGIDRLVALESPFAHDASFWMDIWQVDESDIIANQDESSCLEGVFSSTRQFPSFCRPSWSWFALKQSLRVDRDLARQWLHYHSVYVLQPASKRHREASLRNSDRHIEDFLLDSCIESVLSQFPELAHDEFVLERVLTSQHTAAKSFFQQIQSLFGSDFLLQHSDVVERATRINGLAVLAHLPSSGAVANQERWWELALSNRPEALTEVPWPVQIQFPHLVARAIRDIANKIGQIRGRRGVFISIEDIREFEQEHQDTGTEPLLDLSSAWEQTDFFDLEEFISSDLFAENREVCLAWIRAGGEFLDEMEANFDDDEEILLAMVEMNTEEYLFSLPSRFLKDEDFMRKAVTKNGGILREAVSDMPFDIKLLAFASHPDIVQNYEFTNVNSEDFIFLMKLSSEIRQRLLVHESFVTFVYGFHAGRMHKPSATPIVMLECGRDTSYVFKRLVADYLGIPLGEELRLLRRASEHLENWGF